MLYSSAGILALIIHLIINYDVLRKSGKESIYVHRSYRQFLTAVMVYYISDICWGILYARHLIFLTSLDTSIYFAAMACSILFWTRYVVEYLKEESFFGRLLHTIGKLLFGFQIFVVAVNFFLPVLFSFDETGAYHAEGARYVTMIIQIGMYLMTSSYAISVSARSEGSTKFRHLTIGLASLAMTGFISAQVQYPLLPLYAIGCMLACCIMHSFVFENEKEEYRDELEEKLKENIRKGNYYDLLTGLPGMTYFFELAEKKRTEMIKTGGQPVFLFLDLSGMKFYNQRHGFAQGDRLLQDFANLLIRAFGSENCSRFAQDHFAVFTQGEGLREKLDQLFQDWESGKHAECPAIRVGVYEDQLDQADISTACDRAKAARDVIRGVYVSAVHYYNSAMLVNAERKHYIISHLEEAMEKKWIQVYYQPIVRAANGRVCEEEALTRWIDPERGLLPPADFIPVLEEARLIYKLDLYVVDQILEKNQHLKESGLFLVPQSVNLSRSDFDSCDIVEEICQRVDRAKMPHSLFSIEITESMVGSDLEFIRQQTDRFRALGFPVWMDDFGSGYSSLDVLADIQVDLIKLDMRFMQQFDKGDKGKIILTELIRMALSLGIDTICEGVEREDQVEFLREIGCTKLQGFYYAKPMPMNAILERYEKGTQIGFENPDETAYYDAIGRINLYDLDGISKEEEDTFRHYFSNLPMAIVEVRGDKVRFTRSNQAYRDFMERTFAISLTGLDTSFEPVTRLGTTFIAMLKKCCKEGGRVVFDEKVSGGMMIHSFMRRIAENPLSGTIATAVVVLAVSGED